MEFLSVIECLLLCVFLLVFSISHYKLEKRVFKLEQIVAVLKQESYSDA